MLSKLLSLLFPPNNHEKIIDSIQCLVPEPYDVTTMRGIRVLTCSRYEDTHVQSAIKLLKKTDSPKAAQLLAQLLSDTLLEEVADDMTWNPHKVIIIPLPLTHKRERERGFNQVTQICMRLPKELRELVGADILQQTKQTRVQKSLTRAERFKNVEGVFTVSPRSVLEKTHVILVDDVITTGATMSEAVRTLTKTGARVTAVALARA